MATPKRRVPKRTERTPIAMPADLKALRSDLRFLPRKEAPPAKPSTSTRAPVLPAIQRATKPPLHGKYPS